MFHIHPFEAASLHVNLTHEQLRALNEARNSVDWDAHKSRAQQIMELF